MLVENWEFWKVGWDVSPRQTFLVGAFSNKRCEPRVHLKEFLTTGYVLDLPENFLICPKIEPHFPASGFFLEAKVNFTELQLWDNPKPKQISLASVWKASGISHFPIGQQFGITSLKCILTELYLMNLTNLVLNINLRVVQFGSYFKKKREGIFLKSGVNYDEYEQ